MKPSEITHWETETENRAEAAVAFFRQGYNCAQSVTLALADFYGLDAATLAQLSASFGGGIGRMRETCGAACGMFMMAGMEVQNPQDSPSEPSCSYPDATLKKANYQVVQQLAAEFCKRCGTLLCRELLGLAKPLADGVVPAVAITATPEERTEAYYRRRPCTAMVETAVRIYMEYLQQKYSK
ncbi:MAG: C_GCAxxG_C_C family protein [Bacteroidaceae bacterium]|nr:C_GCAxxG_C_C family protein [Bacteroidaceae bacterium]